MEQLDRGDMMELNKIYNGNNITILRTFPSNSVDSVVTDPPYGISFMNKHWDYDVPNVKTWQEVYRVLKPGGHMLVACGTRTQHRMAVNIEDAGFEIRDIVAWVYGSGFPKSKNVGLAIDKGEGFPDRGHRIATASRNHPDGTFEPNGEDLPAYEAKSELSKPYAGFGTALKPAMELWTLARKPLKGTVAENVLKYGTGGLNIDGCRVEYGNENDKRIGTNFISNGGDASNNSNDNQVPNRYYVQMFKSSGRFPANFIHDGSDEVVTLFPDDADRFFYTAKASQSERNAGLYGFEEESIGKLQGGRKEGSAGSVMPSDGRINPYAGAGAKKRNIHPTVKPLDLMRYLCRLITPPNGIVLDPYIGSGTTAVAAKLEGFQYIGIEMEADYCKIAEARVANCDQDYNTIDDLLSQPGVVEVPTIFDFI